MGTNEGVVNKNKTVRSFDFLYMFLHVFYFKGFFSGLDESKNVEKIVTVYSW